MAKLSDGKTGSIAKARIPQSGQSLIFDDHRDAPRGFGLRITQAGGRAFILRYRSPVTGKERRKTIGQWPTWSLEAARLEARDLRQKLDLGIDPLEEKKRHKDAPLVSQAVEDYIARRVRGLVSESAIAAYLRRDLVPAIGLLKVVEVRRRDLIDMVEGKAAKTPTAARHLLVYTKGFFDWCVDREYIGSSPASSIKPKSISPGGRNNTLKPVKRLRVLDHEEIREFWLNAESCGMDKMTALALKLVLVTGQRPGEVAGIEESEIEGDIWTIPASRRLKTESENRVPLTQLAIQLINQARTELTRLQIRRKCVPTGALFEIQIGKKLQTGGLSKAVARYHQELKIKDKPLWRKWRPHDLRRTCRTGLSACGISEEIAERVIGHRGNGVIGIYNQHAYDIEKRAALQAWERSLRSLVEEDEPAPSIDPRFRRNPSVNL